MEQRILAKLASVPPSSFASFVDILEFFNKVILIDSIDSGTIFHCGLDAMLLEGFSWLLFHFLSPVMMSNHSNEGVV